MMAESEYGPAVRLNNINGHREGATIIRERTEAKKSSSKEKDNYERTLHLQAVQIRRELIYAAIIPALVLLGMGGASGLFTLAIGGGLSYIFDLMESVEGTLICWCLTMFGFAICTLFNMRTFFLENSFNIPIGMIAFISVGQITMISLFQFQSIFYDVGVWSTLFLKLIVATSPILFSCFLAGVLCIEIPEFEIITSFNVIYFLYTWLLARPRIIYQGSVSMHQGFHITRTRQLTSKPLLPSYLMKIIYTLPVLTSMIAHVAIHRNLLMTENMRSLQLAYTMVLSNACMYFVHQLHQRHAIGTGIEAAVALQRPSSSSSVPSSTAATAKLNNYSDYSFPDMITMILLGLLIPSHPIFDELKQFTKEPEPVPRTILFLIGILIPCTIIVQNKLLVFKLYRLGNTQSLIVGGQQEVDENVNSRPNSSSFFRGAASHRLSVPRAVIMQRLTYFGLKFLLAMMVAFIANSLAILIDLPEVVRPINMIGATTLVELYWKEDWNTMSSLLLAVMAGLSLEITCIHFSFMTLGHLVYTFVGVAGVGGAAVGAGYGLGLGLLQRVSIQRFCTMSAALLTSAALLPALIDIHSNDDDSSSKKKQGQRKEGQGSLSGGGLLPSSIDSSSNDDNSSHSNSNGSDSSSSHSIPAESESNSRKTAAINILPPTLSNSIFRLGFLAITFLITALELLILEQDWSGDIVSDDVYPMEYWLASSAMVVVTAFILYQSKVLGLSSFFLAEIIQVGKVLYFFNWEASFILPIILVTCTISLPFLRQLQLSLQYATMIDRLEFDPLIHAQQREQHRLSYQELLFTITLNGIVFLTWGRRITAELLVFILQEPSDMIMLWQEIALAIAMWLLFVGMLSVVFANELSAFRSVIFGVAILLIVLSCEGFGLLAIDWSGIHPLEEHGLIQRSGHEAFFLLLSGILMIIAWLQYVRLDNIFSCFLYSIIFGFVSTKATFAWTFPVSIQLHELLLVDITMDIDAFAFAFLWAYKVVNTFVALWSQYSSFQTGKGSNSNSSSWRAEIFVYSYYVSLLLPFSVFVMTYFLGFPQDLLVGIIWAAIMGGGSLTISFRAREIMAFLNSTNGSGQQHRKDVMDYRITLPTINDDVNFSVTYLMTLAVILWTLLALYFQSTSLDADILLPIAGLLFFCCDPMSLPGRQSAYQCWMKLCIYWWYASVIYHVFFMHTGFVEYLHSPTPSGSNDGNSGPNSVRSVMHTIMPYSVFGWDDNISLWSNDSLFLPMINLLLAVIPIPALALGLQEKRSNSSNGICSGNGSASSIEDMMILWAILSLVAVIASSVDCIRYLGIAGVCLGAYRGYTMNVEKAMPVDRYI